MTANKDAQKALLKRRKLLVKNLTRFEEFIINLDGNKFPHGEFKVRYAKIQAMWDVFDEIQSQIEEFEEDNTREEFENKYYKILGLAEDILSSQTETKTKVIAPTASCEQDIRLPTIQVPIFSGNYDDWSSFYNIFKDLVHDNKFYRNSVKLKYLKNSLRGEAYNIVESLDLTSENYCVALELLKDRYDNPTRAIKKHVASLFDLPKIERESSSALHALVETSQKHIRSLKALGQPTDSWDIILIHLLSSKLDYSTFKEWKKAAPTKELPQMNTFIEFLENHCQRLDELKGHQIAISIKTKPNKFVETKNSSRCLILKNNKSCPLCKEAHALYICKNFIDMTVDKRFSFVKEKHLCINCLRDNHKVSDCKSSLCRTCNKNHHTLLHRIQSVTSKMNTSTEIITPSNKTLSDSQNNRISPTLTFSVHQQSNVLLSTAKVSIFGPNGNQIFCRALLDCGSQSSYLTSSICDRLKLKRNSLSLTVCGFSNSTMPIHHHVKVKIGSHCTTFSRLLDFLVVPRITDYIPQVSLGVKDLPLPPHIILADPHLQDNTEIEMLLGANVFWDIIGHNAFKIPALSLNLRETKLGWIVTGKAAASPTTHCTLVSHLTLESIDTNLRKFWELETIDTPNKGSSEELRCEELYNSTTRRDKTGRYIVQMPLKNDLKLLGDSKETALRRFYSLEKRLNKDPNLKMRYASFIDEYLKLGHMCEVIDLNEFKPTQTRYFVPHHPVFKETSSSTKLRVVFDFSAKTTSGYSLNDILATGPTIQPSLYNHLIRSRTYPILICGDLEKMFRQIQIDPNQTPLQLIFWRNLPDKQLKIFKLLTVSYGTGSASWLATRTLKQLALDHPHPTSGLIEREFYMDDLCSGGRTVEEVVEIKEQLASHLAKGGFNIRKWSSNSVEFMETIPEQDRELKTQVSFDKELSVRTLGLLWLPLEDSFSFSIDPEIFCTKERGELTKRNVLSAIAKLFDPLGLVGPVIVKAKILMQELWRLDYNWDEPLPKTFSKRWESYSQKMSTLQLLKIPRRIIADNYQKIEVHGFADASIEAFGACIYCRSEEHGNFMARLVTSKSRVAPLKVQSLPRLELCAALLLVELMQQTLPSFSGINIDKITYWSDSSIVLSWINAPSNKWTTFVANRVSKIQELSNPNQWKHVQSQHNPADLISRGLYADQIASQNLWWNGPHWLAENSDIHLHGHFVTLNEEDLPDFRKVKVNTLATFNTNAFDKTHITTCLVKLSSFDKIVRVIAYCFRFLRRRHNAKGNRPIGPISAGEFVEAKMTILRIAQESMFPQDYHDLTLGKNVRPASKLTNLCPYLDTSKLIRVGGRLQLSQLTPDKKHPIVLAHGGTNQINKLTFLIAKEMHEKNAHIGPQSLLSVLRDQYWPLNGRNLCRKIYHQCLKCFRAKPKFRNQLMGNLPEPRVEPSRAFYHCGVDYAGPLQVRNSLRKNTSSSKAYISLFICLCTKAIHIELVEDLSTHSFLAALRRFIARRGKPLVLYSDNATNFVGAKNELKVLKQLWESETHKNTITNLLARDNIEWRFIPPRSPNFGGLWESGIKLIKTHLKRIIGSRILTFNECYTVLTQIEACLNSRPLIPLSSDPNDLSALTPAHFLIGCSLLQPPEPCLTQQVTNRLTRWRLVQQMAQHFWRRWSSEYLVELQKRSKWTTSADNLTEGTLVLIKSDQAPQLSWTLGRVVEVHPGPDGKVRVVTIKTSSGLFKRNVRALCALPIEDQRCSKPLIEDCASRGGEMEDL